MHVGWTKGCAVDDSFSLVYLPGRPSNQNCVDRGLSCLQSTGQPAHPTDEASADFIIGSVVEGSIMNLEVLEVFGRVVDTLSRAMNHVDPCCISGAFEPSGAWPFQQKSTPFRPPMFGPSNRISGRRSPVSRPPHPPRGASARTWLPTERS